MKPINEMIMKRITYFDSVNIGNPSNYVLYFICTFKEIFSICLIVRHKSMKYKTFYYKDTQETFYERKFFSFCFFNLLNSVS